MKTSLATVTGRFLVLLGLWLLLAPGAKAGEPHPDFEVAVSGQGKPVLFIPGLATPGVIWQPVVDQLQGSFQCHVVTLAGFGKVKPSGSDPFLSKVRDELIEYIRAEKLDHPMIVGHSLGGFMALWIAEIAPEVPGRLIVVDSLPYLPGILNPSASPEMMREQIAPMIAQMAGSSPDQFTALEHQAISFMVTAPDNIRKVTALTQESDPRTTARAMEELMTTDLRPELGKIECPVVVYIALLDKTAVSPKETVLANFRAQFARLRGVRFESFDHARHFIMVDDLAGLLKALERDSAPAAAR